MQHWLRCTRRCSLQTAGLGLLRIEKKTTLSDESRDVSFLTGDTTGYRLDTPSVILEFSIAGNVRVFRVS